MDLPVSTSSPHQSSSSSGDGLYDLADEPGSAPAPAPQPPRLPAASQPTASSTPAPAADLPELPTFDPSPLISTSASASAAKPEAKAKSKVKPPKEPKAKRSFPWSKTKAPADPAQAEAQAQAATDAAAAEPKPDAGPRIVRRVRKVRRKWDAPAWLVSAVVHVAIIALLASVVLKDEIRNALPNFNAAPQGATKASEEALHILAEPSDAKSTEAVGNESGTTVGGNLGGAVGGGPPSATPVVGGRGSGTAKVGEGASLPTVKVVAAVSGLSTLPAAPGRDLGGSGMIAGDVTFEAKDVGAALDQLVREILRHLSQHKLTVVWLFDESESMKDDQKAIREKFARVSTELKIGVDPKRKDQPLTHAIVGFGASTHIELEKPTADIDLIGRAIDHLRVEPSGTENTLAAVRQVIEHYSGLIRKDRRLLIVLVTDESGDDGGYIEEARQAAKSSGVPIYIIGRQSVFGYPFARLLYIDPITKDHYWPTIHRGPETADVEMYQWDGLHDRWDEQPSGFAPYELARLAKETGGMYFLLPSEENMRIRQREKFYSMNTLKEYVPAYESRAAYNEKRARSELRRTMYEIIQASKNFPHRRHFSVFPEEMIVQANEEFPKVQEKLQLLFNIEKRLRDLKKARDREPERRWQAHYDLMLAQTIAYQIQAYEYMAVLKDMVAKPPRPSRMPSPEIAVAWEMNHAREPHAPKSETEKKTVEATMLLKRVIADHPKTPWADLAQDELDRGFSIKRDEWRRNPKYEERAKFVPHY